MRTAILLFSLLLAAHSDAASLPIQSYQADTAGVTFSTHPGLLRIEPVGGRTFHVIYTAGDSLPTNPLFAVEKQPAADPFQVKEDATTVTLTSTHCGVHIDRSTGALTFLDEKGQPFLSETPDGKSVVPGKVGSLDTNTVEDRFVLDPTEALYGLGQQEGGVMNWVGHSAHLQQRNRDIAIPVLVSSKGYGVFWNNPAVTDVTVSKSTDPNPTVDWKSIAGTKLDYYVFAGPTVPQVIADYRELTGAAPLLGKWGYGFWQCKQRYGSQQQLLDTVAKYREMKVPIDGIIQDWLWWYPTPWGSHIWSDRYPDPTAMMDQLHKENVHLLISVWARFSLGSDNYNELNTAGCLYPQVFPDNGKCQWYDPFNANARKTYWSQMSREIFAKGVDGWWLDASEPELTAHWGEINNYTTGSGPGALVANAYPLMHTTAVYAGQRAETSNKRVFILTRSGYAGIQRNSSVSWSGDIVGTWGVFRQQIPNGLNFSLSGVPYWNTDTGGFFDDAPSKPGYPELFTRWFQFSAFCPMFRVHGDATQGYDEPPRHDRPGKEMWQFPPDVEKTLIAYDNLRYHLLPYIYSVAWQVTSANDTMMRALIMDFQGDHMVSNIADQYMFGPAIMVNPVIEPGAKTRFVYLPWTSWTDFWTGETLPGGQTITAQTPLETLPLYVRAGSIIPYGPSVQSSADAADPIELRVYPGANGTFTLYEDDGATYDYEKGAHATIPFTWDDTAKKLTIGARHGSFPGMLNERTFRVVFVRPNHGAGLDTTEKPDAEIRYTGIEQSVQR
jgi:alpha-D-xyloside xylohydrolase